MEHTDSPFEGLLDELVLHIFSFLSEDLQSLDTPDPIADQDHAPNLLKGIAHSDCDHGNCDHGDCDHGHSNKSYVVRPSVHNKQGFVVSQVSRAWYQHASKFLKFWAFSVGSPPLAGATKTEIETAKKVDWSERFLWTNQVVNATLMPCNCTLNGLHATWTQNWLMGMRLELNRSYANLVIFDRDPEADNKFIKAKEVSLEPYLEAWDSEDWQRVYVKIDLQEPVAVKKGQFVGLTYTEPVHELVPDDQKYWPHIPNKKEDDEKDVWPLYYDYNQETGEMEGLEEMTQTGWIAYFTGKLPSL